MNNDCVLNSNFLNNFPGSDFIQFMVSLASMVAWIDVVVSKSGFTSPYVVPFVHEMMDRKCNTLRFEDEQSPISLADTEKLVQVNLQPFNRSNRVILFCSLFTIWKRKYESQF